MFEDVWKHGACFFSPHLASPRIQVAKQSIASSGERDLKALSLSPAFSCAKLSDVVPGRGLG